LWYNGTHLALALSTQGCGRASTVEPPMASPPDLSARPLDVVVEHPAPDVRVLRISGELDIATTPRLLQIALEDGEHDPPPRLVLDLDGVTFLGSCGLRALLACDEARTLRLVGVSRAVVARPLQITGLDVAFEIHPDVAAALGSFG